MIVVTTPTGNVGHHVVRNLLDAGEALRVIGRDPARLPQEVRDRVEVVQGSHGDAAIVDKAFAGAEAVFWLAPPVPSKTLDDTYLNFARPAAEAIRRCGVARVVAVTPLGRDTAWADRAGLVTASMRMIDLLNDTGAAVRSLAVPALMENALQQVSAIKQGQMVGPLDPDRKVPHIATRDIGAAAARLLADASWTKQHDVPLFGPEELSFTDLAAIASRVLGRDITYRQVPFDTFKAQLMEHGMSDAFAQGYADMMRAKNEGMDNAAAGPSAQTGPTTFQQWAEEQLKPAVLD